MLGTLDSFLVGWKVEYGGDFDYEIQRRHMEHLKRW